MQILILLHAKNWFEIMLGDKPTSVHTVFRNTRTNLGPEIFSQTPSALVFEHSIPVLQVSISLMSSEKPEQDKSCLDLEDGFNMLRAQPCFHVGLTIFSVFHSRLCPFPTFWNMKFSPHYQSKCYRHYCNCFGTFTYAKYFIDASLAGYPLSPPFT